MQQCFYFGQILRHSYPVGFVLTFYLRFMTNGESLNISRCRTSRIQANLNPARIASYSTLLFVALNWNWISCWTLNPTKLVRMTPSPLTSVVEDPSTYRSMAIATTTPSYHIHLRTRFHHRFYFNKRIFYLKACQCMSFYSRLRSIFQSKLTKLHTPTTNLPKVFSLWRTLFYG